MLTVKVLSPEKTELDMADGVNEPAGTSSVRVTGERMLPPRGLRPRRAWVGLGSWFLRCFRRRYEAGAESIGNSR